MELFDTSDRRPVHFMGIGGAGMSALALIACRRGVSVSGCDNDISGTADLTALGGRGLNAGANLSSPSPGWGGVGAG